jgi:hypothetical protein
LTASWTMDDLVSHDELDICIGSDDVVRVNVDGRCVLRVRLCNSYAVRDYNKPTADRLRAALQALVDKLTEVEPHIATLFAVNADIVYDGPNYGAEFDAARAVLNESDYSDKTIPTKAAGRRDPPG